MKRKLLFIIATVFLVAACHNDDYIYNPQIQISAESETKRSIFRKRDKTKRSKKGKHATLKKPKQKVCNDFCFGFIIS